MRCAHILHMLHDNNNGDDEDDNNDGDDGHNNVDIRLLFYSFISTTSIHLFYSLFYFLTLYLTPLFLFLFRTQPWIPTKAFPHPLSCLSYRVKWTAEIYYSYQAVDRMLWISLERSINKLRVHTLNLPPVRML